MTYLHYFLTDENATVAVGTALADTIKNVLKQGVIAFLNGDLGAGKTTFVTGLMACFDYTSAMSPSFSIVNDYQTSTFRFYHMDLYRLKDERDFVGIDLDRYMDDQQAILLVEWPEKLGLYKPSSYIDLQFSYVSETCRNITMTFSDTFDASRFLTD